MYLDRHAQARLRSMARHFRVVLVTGARQVGKTTLLRHAFPRLPHVVFDPVQDLHGARADPDLFLANHPPPVILDEIQYAPELLAAIKRHVDAHPRPGAFLLTGSQHLGALRTVSESLAGRAGILHLTGLTLAEMRGEGGSPGWLEAYLNHPNRLPDTLEPRGLPRWPSRGQGRPLPTPARLLWRGTLPGLLEFPDREVSAFLSGYIQTYVERDVRTAGEVREMQAFSRFIGLLGALTAQEVNHAALARELGVSATTVAAWLALVGTTFQWRELPAFSGNTLKRVVGRGKGHLADSGLACALQRIPGPEGVPVARLAGALFESFVVQDLLGQCSALGLAPTFFHWRAAGGAEVDLILDYNARLYPIEIKFKSEVSGNDQRGIRAFREAYPDRTIAPGVVVYAGESVRRLSDIAVAVPWSAAPSKRRGP